MNFFLNFFLYGLGVAPSAFESLAFPAFGFGEFGFAAGLGACVACPPAVAGPCAFSLGLAWKSGFGPRGRLSRLSRRPPFLLAPLFFVLPYFLSIRSKSEFNSDRLSFSATGLSGFKSSKDSGIIPFLFRSMISWTRSHDTGIQTDSSPTIPNHIIRLKISVFCKTASPFLVFNRPSMVGMPFSASM